MLRPYERSCSLVWSALVGLFRSRASLEAEILILRHSLTSSDGICRSGWTSARWIG